MSFSRQMMGAVCAGFLAVAATPSSLGADNARAELNVIYMGSSLMQRASYLFSQQAALDLGVDVQFIQRMTSSLHFATANLTGTSQWAIVSEADILIIVIEGPILRRQGYCLDTPSDTPRSDSLEQLEVELDVFLTELMQHVDPSESMVRIGLPAVKPQFREIWVERGLVQECAQVWEARADIWRKAAGRYGIGLIDVRALWNGPDGTIGSPIELYAGDHVHLNEEGSKVVAEIIRSTGYAPLHQQ